MFRDAFDCWDGLIYGGEWRGIWSNLPMFLLLSCFSVQAQQGQSQQSLVASQDTSQSTGSSTDVGEGVVYDTRQQVERFAVLRGDGRGSDEALDAVNSEFGNHAACNLVAVIFTESKPVAGLRIDGRQASILEITVQAFGNGIAWRPVPAIAQYTVVTEKGQPI